MAFVGYRNGSAYGVWAVSPPDDRVVELADDHPDIVQFRLDQEERLRPKPDKLAELETRIKALEARGK